ncbi:signal recognition particle-docking protein FtsY [Corynebacterium matruchotii ATCC 33806]|uniref:Signal recognition particle receptor FtsY n=2 Tax=Corynebacterium matruchotii TaxID=43768 RepID=C0E4X2_9CORY|nr:signal recognition particle-docking protein FtsY [Corynebacterium matruchotii ATCC 33806]
MAIFAKIEIMEAAIIVVLVVVFAILVVMMIIALGSRRKDSKTISFESKTTDEPKQLTQQEKSGNYQAQGGFNFAPAKKEEAVLPGQELKTSATAAIPTAAQPAPQPTAHIDAPSASAVSEKPHEDPEPVAEAAVAEPETLTVETEAKPEDPAVVTKKPEKETEKEDEPVAAVTETAEDSEPDTKPEEPDAKSEAAENEEQPEAEPVDDEPVEKQSAVAEPEADNTAEAKAETDEAQSAKKPVETDEAQSAKKPAAADESAKEEVAEAPQPEEQPEPSKPGRQKRNKPQKRQKQRGKKQQSRAAAQEKLEEAVAADEASEKPQKSDSDTTKDHKEEPAPQNAQSDRDEQAKDVADTELEGSFEKLDEFHELVEELPDSEEIPVVEQAEPEDVDKQDALEAAAAATAVVEAADKARAETAAPTEKPKPADAEPKPQDTIEPAVGRIGKLRGRLSKSQNVFGRSVLGMLSAGDLDDDAWEDIETQLIQADLGVKITTNVVDELREMIAERGVSSEDEARAMLRECLIAACKPELDRSIKAMPYNGKPAVVLVVGVNGTGKTTTTGKLARVLVSMGHKVLLGAADTFRAAAADQLEAWGRRVGATTVRGAEAADPASVAFDAVSKGVETHADVVLIDTAGRLHNSTNLMDQLRKVKRVVEKKAVVDEVLLVLDATTGQNGLVQAKTFGDVVNITGVVLTKLDGTAKGGIVFQVQEDLGVPVKLVGLGEGADDLAPFEVEGFVDALLG